MSKKLHYIVGTLIIAIISGCRTTYVEPEGLTTTLTFSAPDLTEACCLLPDPSAELGIWNTIIEVDSIADWNKKKNKNPESYLGHIRAMVDEKSKDIQLSINKDYRLEVSSVNDLISCFIMIDLKPEINKEYSIEYYYHVKNSLGKHGCIAMLSERRLGAEKWIFVDKQEGSSINQRVNVKWTSG